MLDLKFIRENFDYVKSKVETKKIKVDLEKFKELDEKRRKLQTEVDSLKAERNRLSKEIGKLKSKGEDISEITKSVKEISAQIKEKEEKLKEIEKEFYYLYSFIPNLPHNSVPIGVSEEDNVVVKDVNIKVEKKYKVLDHIQIAEKLNLIDFKRGAKITGRGFVVYRGFGARLERALINFMLDLHTKEHGYEEIYPPFFVNRDSAFGTGQLPKSEDQMYYIEKDDLFAIPTAEVPVTNLYRNEVLSEDELPKKFVAFSPCFRREAGSWGKDTRGLLRLHQFNKVELVKYTLPENSYEELELLRENAEKVLKLLELPYRVVELCTADLSFAAAKCYDLELWAPGTGKFLEVSSISNFEDFQARRINIKYKRKNGEKGFVHTLNGSGVATARLMVAILENYQNADGSLTIPDVLRDYVGGISVYKGE